MNNMLKILLVIAIFSTASAHAMGLSDFNQNRCLQPSSCRELPGGVLSLHIEPGEERAELRDPRVIAFGDAIAYQVQLRLPSASELSTNGGSVVILQFKAQNGMSPPMAFRVKQDGSLVITVRHDIGQQLTNDGNGFEEVLYRGPMAKDEWHAFSIQVRSGESGSLQVMQDGRSIVNYEGSIGYSGVANYIKFGPYDYSKSQRTAYELQYREYSVVALQ